MGTKQNIIHLNGKLYDAKTGKPVKHSPNQATSDKAVYKRRASMDGFFAKRKSSHATKQTAIKHPVNKNKPTETKATKTREVKHTLPRKPEKSKTLMRRAVSRPSFIMQGTSPVKTEEDTTQDNIKASPVDNRLKRAMSVKKSNKISRFSLLPSSVVFEKREEPIPVKDVPISLAQAPKQTVAPISTRTSNHQTHKPSKAEEHFNRALSKSHAHEKTHKKVKKPRKLAHRLGVSHKALSVASTAMAVIMLGGFFAYQNIPNISMRIAASRAGINAKLPGYKPSGYALSGPIQYEPGRITIGFGSNSDNRRFEVSQQVSGWNSEALVDNYLSANNKTYQTYQDKGRTIYLYDTSSATWVSGGVWYNIDGNDVLSNDQLIRVASSL